MKKLLLLSILLIGTLFSNTNYQSPKEKDIIILLEKMNSSELALQSMIDLIGLYKKNLPNIPDKYWRDFMSEVNTDDLIILMIPIYDKYFTHNDISALIRFYDSQIGRKLIKMQPYIITESMQAGAKWSEDILLKLDINK